jgi:hypothetical protein
LVLLVQVALQELELLLMVLLQGLQAAVVALLFLQV